MRLIAGKQLIAGVLLLLIGTGPVWGQAVDQAQLSGSILDSVLTEEFGQTFTPGLTGKLVSVRLFVGKKSVDGSNFTVRIWTLNALGGIVDPILATGFVAQEDLENEPNWIEVALIPTDPLWEQTAGKKIALTIDEDTTEQNRYGMDIGNPSPYSGGDFFGSYLLGNPIVPSPHDLAFQTLVVAGEYVYYFRQGTDSGQGLYFEANDVTIGNTVIYPGDDYLRVETPVIGLEKYNSLIRFRGIEKNLGNLRVTRASVSLTFYNYGLQNSNPAIIKTQGLLKPFSDDRTKCTWANYDAGLLWETPGAQGATDRDAIFTTTNLGPHSLFSPYKDGTIFEFEIPAGLVQQWIRSPESNHGVLLSMQTTQVTWAQFYSSDYISNLSYRPLLTIIAAAGCDKIPADINDDCYVNEYDLYLMHDQWLLCDGGSADIVDAGDGCVNLLDYALLAAQWLQCSDPGDVSCIWPN